MNITVRYCIAPSEEFRFVCVRACARVCVSMCVCVCVCSAQFRNRDNSRNAPARFFFFFFFFFFFLIPILLRQIGIPKLRRAEIDR